MPRTQFPLRRKARQNSLKSSYSTRKTSSQSMAVKKDMAQVLEQQEQIFQKMLKTLDHKKTLYDQESTGERFRSLSNQMNRVLHKAKQLEDLHRILNDSISAAAHSRAQTVHQAAEAAGQHTQGLKTLLDAWGTEPGERAVR